MKNLRKLNKDGSVETLVEIPDSIVSMDSIGETIYLTSPENGLIYRWDGSFNVFASRLDGVQGIHCHQEFMVCENTHHHFFTLRYFDRMLTSLCGKRAKKDLRSTKHTLASDHPRINGLHYHYSYRRVYFAYTERHHVYCLEGSVISPIIGTGKADFSIGMGGNCSLSHPSDVLDYNNKLLVSDTGNHVIREFYMDGFSQDKMIGFPLQPGRVDGKAMEARLNCPTDMTIQDDTLYFVDNYDSIRSVLLTDLTVTTIYQSPKQVEFIAMAPKGSVYFVESAK